MARAARKPKDDDGAVEVKKKDFDRAAKLYRQDIKPAVSKAGEAMQEASTAYKVMKKECHIQPQAAKLAFKLADMEEARRDDFLRCLGGLLKEFNIAIVPTDLIDLMGGGEGETRPKPQLGLVTLGQPSTGDETDLGDVGEDIAEDEDD